MDVDTVLQGDPFASLPKEGYDIITSMDHSFVHCTGILAMPTSARNMDFLADWEDLLPQVAMGSLSFQVGTFHYKSLLTKCKFSSLTGHDVLQVQTILQRTITPGSAELRTSEKDPSKRCTP